MARESQESATGEGTNLEKLRSLGWELNFFKEPRIEIDGNAYYGELKNEKDNLLVPLTGQEILVAAAFLSLRTDSYATSRGLLEAIQPYAVSITYDVGVVAINGKLHQLDKKLKEKGPSIKIVNISTDRQRAQYIMETADRKVDKEERVSFQCGDKEMMERIKKVIPEGLSVKFHFRIPGERKKRF